MVAKCDKYQNCYIREEFQFTAFAHKQHTFLKTFWWTFVNFLKYPKKEKKIAKRIIHFFASGGK